MLYRSSTALLILLLTLAAWGFVGYFAWTISTDEAKLVTDAQDARIKVVQRAQAIRTHAIAVDAAPDAEALKSLLNVDVVSASYMIEEVGRAAGVKLRLSDAQPEGDVGSDILPLKAVGFIVTADGKFPELLHAIRLFETLPLPSSVARFDIERTAGSGGKAPVKWHLNAYIRVLTTSAI